MSEQEPSGPYVYQKYGWATDPEKGDRLWAVSHLPSSVEGLTLSEAQEFLRLVNLDALKKSK